MKTIRIHANQATGPIKPMHGVGGGPVTNHFTYNAIPEFKEAGIPFSRTHDIEYPFGSGEYVDIHCIFRDFDKDVNDPASYNFVFTDEYLKSIIEARAKPFYRLGSTIEHQPIKRYIFPPEDNTKWGEICSHIIAHYNDGWADGFHMGIEYWEIWNEPESKTCWQGTDDEFIALYVTAAKVIKKNHPEVKVGGCGFICPGSPLSEKWLAGVRKTGAPLDFFSWHGYCRKPETAREYAETAAALLRKYGFDRAEIIYDEWNYVVNWAELYKSVDLHKTAFGAAFVAAVMSEVQKTPADMMMYYDAQMILSDWNGLFSKLPTMVHAAVSPVKREKPYYCFKAWNELYRAGTEIFCEAPEDCYVTAAAGNGDVVVLLSYFNDDAGYGESAPADDIFVFELDGMEYTEATACIVDNENDYTPKTLTDGMLPVQGNSFVLIRFSGIK